MKTILKIQLFLTAFMLLAGIKSYGLDEEVRFSYITIPAAQTYNYDHNSHSFTLSVNFTINVTESNADTYRDLMNDRLANRDLEYLMTVNNVSADGFLFITVNANPWSTPRSFSISGNSGNAITIIQSGTPATPPDPGPVGEEKLNIGGNWILNRTYTSSTGTKYEDITFYNGLGSPEQIIHVGASLVNSKNIVTPVVYDQMMRSDAKSYLPYVSTNNTAVKESDATGSQTGYYTGLYGSLDGNYAYTQKTYEASPLNRVFEEWNSGGPFRTAGKKRTLDYNSNLADDVFKIEVNSTNNAITVGYYAAGSLYANTTTNEDGGVYTSYTDKNGRMVLERHTGSGMNDQDTYYAYDSPGRLCWVITPEGSALLSAGTYAPSSNLAKQYSYVYSYDGRGHIIEKQQPGREAEYYIYDKGNRLVLYQDGNLRTGNQWIYTAYDNLNRETERSVVRTERSRSWIQERYLLNTFVNSYPTLGSLYNPNIPVSFQDFTLVKILGSTRYYGYDYLPLVFPDPDSYNIALSNSVYMLVHTDDIVGWGASGLDYTGQYLKEDDHVREEYYICSDPGDASYKYYYVPIDCELLGTTLEENDPMGAYELVYNYPGTGTPLSSVTVGGFMTEVSHPRKSLPYAVTSLCSASDVDTLANAGRKEYERALLLSSSSGAKYKETGYYYNHKGDLIQTVEKQPDGELLRTSYQYDFEGHVLGREEKYGSDIKTTTYTYTPRGELLSESTTLNGGTAGTVTYSYNDLGQLVGKSYGNGVTETLGYNLQGWQTSQQVTKNGTGLYSQELVYYNPAKGSTGLYTGNISEWSTLHGGLSGHTYGFSYDKTGRLTGSNHYSGSSTAADNYYTERGISYDRNGNIQTLQRYSTAQTANFIYSYTGNKLASLSGTQSGSYAYDSNGNMTTDGRKNLQIRYNVVNLAESVKEGSSVRSEYEWFSDGSKYSVRDNGTNGYYYIGSLTYRLDAGALVFSLLLESSDFGGGRLYRTGVHGSEPYYHTTDHLGSVRLITGSTGQVLERNDYYPFGTRHSYGASYPQHATNRYKYNGKEEQTTGNLGYIDYGARMYDAELGRWFVPDPLGEKYYPYSAYNYCMNGPVKFVDPDGREVRVAEEYREQFNNSLNSVFGNYSQNFNYNSDGVLTYDGSTKGMSKDQKAAFKGLNKVMNESTITNIVYGESTQITDNNGNISTINASMAGGALTVLASENPNLSQNTILVNPSMPAQMTVMEVMSAYYMQPIDPANGARFRETTVQTSLTDVTMHEIGHVVYQGQTQNKVIDFNNIVRKILNLPKRPYDETHNKNVKQTNYQ